MAVDLAMSLDGSSELVLVQDGQVLGDHVGGQAGEEGELLTGVLGDQEPDPFEAPDVAVDVLLGVVGAGTANSRRSVAQLRRVLPV
jgi:hypothetical protein